MDMNTAVLFSGQGSQRPGMMCDIFESYPECKEIFSIARKELNRDIYDLVSRSSQEELNKTVNTQPALLVCELAVLRVLKTLGIVFDATAGFSLGEWTAIVAADAVSEADAIKLIAKRAEAMQNAVPVGQGAMAYVLGKEDDYIERLCAETGVALANYNTYGNLTVAGTTENIELFLKRAEAENIMAAKLPVSVPSHSPLMGPAVEALAPLIENMPVKEPLKALYMNAVGKQVNNMNEIKTCLIRQLTRPVMFRQLTEEMLKNCDVFIEIGPSNTLCNMVKRTARNLKKPVKLYPVTCLAELEKLAEDLGAN